MVGCLGTDGFTRSLEDLLMRAKALRVEGIHGCIYCGSYQVPTPTLLITSGYGDGMPPVNGLFALAMFGASGIAVPLFAWTPGLSATVALARAYVFVNAVARPRLMAALANVSNEIRGTVLGLNVTSAAFGWRGAASLGGWVMAMHGFTMFGPLAAGVGVFGRQFFAEQAVIGEGF